MNPHASAFAERHCFTTAASSTTSTSQAVPQAPVPKPAAASGGRGPPAAPPPPPGGPGSLLKDALTKQQAPRAPAAPAGGMSAVFSAINKVRLDLAGQAMIHPTGMLQTQLLACSPSIYQGH